MRPGVGATVTLSVGGKLDNIFNQPVELTGTVEFAGPASFRFGGEGYTGVEQDMGPSAVVRAGNVFVLIVSTSVMTVDPELYRAVGLEPKDAQIVVVKSAIQFRAGYPFARRSIMLDSPGMSSDHIATLPWQQNSPSDFSRSIADRCRSLRSPSHFILGRMADRFHSNWGSRTQVASAA